jgi:hypothetical protein
LAISALSRVEGDAAPPELERCICRVELRLICQLTVVTVSKRVKHQS